MFLSKSRHGYYYIWYTDENGKRRKVSTHSKTKSGALNALRSFNKLTGKRGPEVSPKAVRRGLP